MKYDTGRVHAGIGEELTDNDLEQIPANKRCLGALDQGSIFTRAVVALDRPLARSVVKAIRGGGGRARRSGSRDTGHLEFVAMDRRDLSHMVYDQDLVGQVEDEIALIVGPRQMQLHWLELENHVVSKRAIKPEMLILGAAE